MGLVRSPPSSDGDEAHPILTRDRKAPCLGIDPDDAAHPNRDVNVADPPVSRSSDDHVHLFLSRPGFVVLHSRRVRGEVKPVDTERLNADFSAHEPDRATRARALDVLDVDDRVAHVRHRIGVWALP